MSLLIMESVNCFVKKHFQVGKCVIAVSTESLETRTRHFSKLTKFSIITNFYSFN